MVVGLLHEHVSVARAESGFMQQLGHVTMQVQLRDFVVAGAIDGKQFFSGTDSPPPI